MSTRINRKNDELREVRFIRDFTKHAAACVLVQFGDTKVIVTASIEEGKPKWMAKEDNRGWITAEYSLLPTATHTRCQRERSKISGRTQEIQRLIGRSIRSCVDLTLLGERTITIDADVIQADGGTRCASICGAYITLEMLVKKLIAEGKLEKSPILEPIAAVSCGLVDGEILLDLEYSEDSTAQVDSNVVMTKSGKIIEFQTTAEGNPFEKTQLLQIYDTAEKAIKQIIEKYEL